MLERLQAEASDSPPEPQAAAAFAQVPGLSAAFAPERDRAALNHGADAMGAYREFGREAPPFEAPERPEPQPAETAPPPSAPDPQPQPAHLLRLSLEEIAGDLALSPQDTLETLAAKRRRFARINHPDRYEGDWRAAATRRMTMANMLIDEAARRLRRQAERESHAAPAARRRTPG